MLQLLIVKLLRVFIVLSIFLAVFYLFKCQPPYISEEIHAEIKKDMSVAEVLQVVDAQPEKPDSCSWKMVGIDESDDFIEFGCKQPEAIFFNDPYAKEAQFTITIVGPGYLKNHFTITFNKNGKVIDISDIQQWD